LLEHESLEVLELIKAEILKSDLMLTGKNKRRKTAYSDSMENLKTFNLF
jgi:hypothetical protein